MNNPHIIEIEIPPEIKQYVPDLSALFNGMVYKLHKNRHKGKWEDLDLSRAMELIQDEIEELDQALNFGQGGEALIEACDVANFALIIASIILRGNKSYEGNVIEVKEVEGLDIAFKEEMKEMGVLSALDLGWRNDAEKAAALKCLYNTQLLKVNKNV
jgi:hypothetical protein